MAEETKQKGIKDDAAELARILTNNSLMEQKICGIIEYHLKQGISTETFDNITEGLNILIGEKAARLICEACRINSREFFEEELKEEIEEESANKVIPFLQYIVALYGSEMEKADDLSKRPNNWKRMMVRTFRWEGEKRWLVELNLTKRNDEKVYLRMPVGGTLQLVRGLLREVGKLPKEAVSKETIKRFNEETKSFQEKFLVGVSRKE